MGTKEYFLNRDHCQKLDLTDPATTYILKYLHAEIKFFFIFGQGFLSTGEYSMQLHRTVRIAIGKNSQPISNAAVIALVVCSMTAAGPYDASVSVAQNYQNWQWDSTYVLTNNIVTMAVVPAIGGRIMQYDLGTHPSIWINPVYFGQTFYTTKNFYANYGGYKMWVAPQGNWKAKWGGVWPPSSILDFFNYSSQVLVNSVDSCVLKVLSQVDTDTSSALTGLRFSRTMTLYKGSSRVSVAQTVINTASASKRWSVWDNTQVVGSNSTPPADDYSSFWVYYPRQNGIPSDSPGCVITRSDTTGLAPNQIVPNVATGINGYNYNHHLFKIGAHSEGGWLAYSDEADGYVYVKMFKFDPSAQYPDSGSTVEVFSYNDTLIACIELEVLGPMTDLAPSGGSTTFTIDWYAAHVHGPVIAATRAGVVCNRLAMGQGSVFSGKYGPFYSGRVDLLFNNSTVAARSYAVTPLDSLQINEAITVPGGATKVALCLYNSAGVLVDTLDKGNLSDIGVIAPLNPRSVPRVAMAGDRIVFKSRSNEPRSIALITLNGAVAWEWNGTLPDGGAVRLPAIAKGSYLVRVKSGAFAAALIMVRN
jgi:hypothetical protein